ncbi:LysE family transporter [Fodinicola feengrottensis]|uniref:LysE family transporter n=1 Tax=Fodinicola feengrottensis TaxID=435914 RepID=UPI002440F452|nr:LysE family transporter [Fodinicola feengrottensis]
MPSPSRSARHRTLLVTLSARVSLRVGAAAGLGVATADGGYALIATLGGAALAGVIAPIAAPLRWVSVVVLIGLAVRTTWAATRHFRDQTEAPPGAMVSTPFRAYAVVLGLTLLNPTTVLYFAALVIGRRSGALTLPEELAFAVAAFVASASWQLTLAGGGALLGRLLTTAKGRLISAYVSSAVIVALAVNTVLS